VRDTVGRSGSQLPSRRMLVPNERSIAYPNL
jgi:hypothetical protein